MPFTQIRAVALIEAGLFYRDVIISLRRNLEVSIPAASNAMDILESEAPENTKRQAATTLWETLRIVTDILNVMSTKELDAHETLSRELGNFSKTVQKKNDAHAAYMRRWRIRKGAEDSTLVIGDRPIKTKPRNDPEQERFLSELHKRLWSIEKDSWLVEELVETITANAPKQSPTIVLQQLVETNRVAYIRATNRYEVENPNLCEETETDQ